MLSEDNVRENFEEDCEIELNSQVFTRLTKVVRSQYFHFLEKQLEENMRAWQEHYESRETTETESIAINECAKLLEDLAIKQSIITQLYQRTMIKTIADVKQNTKDKILVEQLAKILKNNEQSESICLQIDTREISTETDVVDYASKAIQTEELINVSEKVPSLSLDERIDLFQLHLKRGRADSTGLENLKPVEHIKKQNSKRMRIHCQQRSNHLHQPSTSKDSLVWHSPTPPPSEQHAAPATLLENAGAKQGSNALDVDLESDEIAQELEKIFEEQEPNLEEIFGIAIPPSTSRNQLDKMETQCETSELPNAQIDDKKDNSISKETDKVSTKPAMIIAKSNEQQYPAPITDLRYSLWPCECFMRKRKLSATLSRLIEEDIRWYDVLKWQFYTLFGDDSVDDFAPCSPSIELDTILQNSCMHRISPWVVKHLMKPLNDGLIGNRFLFKKLAKKLAHHIIMENQYPDEHVIKNVIENYFCMHRAVMTVGDLDDVKMISISNYDELS